MNLILLDERDRLESSQVTISDARAAHLLNVLKVAPGQAVRVGLLDGPLGVGTVEPSQLAASFGIMLLVLSVGFMLFSHVEHTFMDTV